MMVLNVIAKLRLVTRKHPQLVNCLLVSISTVLSLLVVEYGFRIVAKVGFPRHYAEVKQYFDIRKSDNSLQRFIPHPYLSYVRSDTYYEDNGIRIKDRFFSFEKEDGVIRIACLGGSTTRDAHPLYLEWYLERQPGMPKFEVVDFGCDGWTTQESLINYIIRVQDFKPDIVLFHHAVNDSPPRQWGDFRPDYSNFRTSWQDQGSPVLKFLANYSYLANSILIQKGYALFDVQSKVIRKMPEANRHPSTPESIITFKRNVQTIYQLTKSAGARLVLTTMPFQPELLDSRSLSDVKEHNRFLLEFARENDVPVIETQVWLHRDKTRFADGVHLKREGIYLNTQIYAQVIKDALRGYSEIYNPSTGTIAHEKVLTFDHHYVPLREIELHWNFDLPVIRDYHVYVRVMHEMKIQFIWDSGSSELNSMKWNQDPDGIANPFRNGPQLGKHYEMEVFAITDDADARIQTGPGLVAGRFETSERIIFQKR